VRDLALADIGRYEQELLDHLRSSKADLIAKIADSGKLEEDTEQALVAALDQFTGMFEPSRKGE
jgi:F-type H+-transporting ATPase subunit alpha